MTPSSGFLNRTNNINDAPILKLALVLRSDWSDIRVVERLVLERLLPDLAEADRRVEAVEDGQRHRHVGDDRPHPLAAVKLDLKCGQMLNNDGSCL